MENSTEQWKQVPFAPNCWVSNEGRVKSIRTGTLLIQRPRGKWGKYLCVDLCHKAAKVTVNVHRLVAALFLPPAPSRKHQIAHNDGNPANNRADNLRWATRRENMADCLRHGTRRRGERVNTCKLSERQVREIRGAGGNNASLARSYGVTPAAIYAIKNRKTWAWVA
jgi:hypothetical protein